MNLDHLVTAALSVLWWLLPVVILLIMMKTRWFKGAVGEAWVRVVAWLRLPAQTYHRLHHLANGARLDAN